MENSKRKYHNCECGSKTANLEKHLNSDKHKKNLEMINEICNCCYLQIKKTGVKINDLFYHSQCWKKIEEAEKEKEEIQKIVKQQGGVQNIIEEYKKLKSLPYDSKSVHDKIEEIKIKTILSKYKKYR